MGLGVLVDVVIGLSVFFWLVATGSSFIVEAINSFLNTRARALELFVREMLIGKNDWLAGWRSSISFWEPQNRAPLNSTDQVVKDLDITTHPLIRRLYKPAISINNADTAPSYIPAELFSTALLDRLSTLYSWLTVGRKALEELDVALAAVPPSPPVTVLRAAISQVLADGRAAIDLTALTRELAAAAAAGQLPAIANAMLAGLGGQHGIGRVALSVVANALSNMGGATGVATVLQSVEVALRKLPARPLTVAELRAVLQSGRLPSDLADALRPLLDAANHDIEAFRTSIERWYDGVMDRASGWFRRYAQVWLFFVALALSIGFNLDSLYVADRLLKDPAVRDSAARLGQQVQAMGREAGSQLQQMYTFRAVFGDDTARPAVKPVELGSSAAAPDSAASGAAALAALAPAELASKMQPLLLRHGATLAPMLELQVEVLARLRACKGQPVPKSCTDKPATAPPDEPSVKLSAALCRAKLLAGDPAAVNEQVRSKLRVATPNDLAKAEECKATVEALKEPTGKADSAAWLWSHPELVWDAELGRTTWAVLRASALELDLEAPATELLLAKAAALARARTSLVDVDAAGLLLPKLGHVQAAYVHWKGGDGSCCSAGRFLLSLLGWLITAFMASLGAPLWFDLLTHLTNRRITGPRPETT